MKSYMVQSSEADTGADADYLWKHFQKHLLLTSLLNHHHLFCTQWKDHMN